VARAISVTIGTAARRRPIQRLNLLMSCSSRERVEGPRSRTPPVNQHFLTI
jgi:hypothetical protein